MSELADRWRGILTRAARPATARRAWEFLWTVRFHLHYVAGRAEERLTFDLQPVVGARMGYTRHGRQDGVERFMRHYFLTAREVSRLTGFSSRRYCAPRSARRRSRRRPTRRCSMRASCWRMASCCRAGADFDDEPIQMLRILQVARDRNLELHPLAIRSLIQNERRAVALRGNPEAADDVHGPAVRQATPDRTPNPATRRRALAGAS